MADELDALMRPEPEPETDDVSCCMAVRPRAESSAAIDEWEQARLNGTLDSHVSWVIPFYQDDRMTPEPLTKQEVALLRNSFGISAEEWTELFQRRTPL